MVHVVLGNLGGLGHKYKQDSMAPDISEVFCISNDINESELL